MEFQKAYNDDICDFCDCWVTVKYWKYRQKKQDYNSFYTKKESQELIL